MLFDHVAGNAQPARDFFLMQVLEPAHHEDLPAPGRQAFDGGLKPVHQLLGFEARIRRGRRRGEIVQRLLIIAVFLFRSAAARKISGEIGGGRLEQRRRLQYGRVFAMAQHAQKRLLRKIGRGLRSDAARQESQQALTMARERDTKRWGFVIGHLWNS